MGPVELSEARLLRARRHAGTAIGDFDAGLTISVRGSHVDLGAGKGVFGGVLQEVDEHLLDEQLVDRYEWKIGRQVDLDRPVLESLLDPQERYAEGLLQWLPRLLHGQRAGL